MKLWTSDYMIIVISLSMSCGNMTIIIIIINMYIALLFGITYYLYCPLFIAYFLLSIFRKHFSIIVLALWHVFLAYSKKYNYNKITFSWYMKRMRHIYTKYMFNIVCIDEAQYCSQYQRALSMRKYEYNMQWARTAHLRKQTGSPRNLWCED